MYKKTQKYSKSVTFCMRDSCVLREGQHQVNILIFDKKNDETIIESKRFNKEGLLIGWPIGFFSIEEE